MAEKIIEEHSDREVSAGEIAIVKVDYCFTHDASGPLVISQLKELSMKLHDPKKTIVFIDHAVPSPRFETSNDHERLRAFVKESGCKFSDSGGGICHQIMAEDYASPGDLIIGSDSHTVMAGALGAFATGMGATDVAVAMALGRTWLRVPESLKIELHGQLPKAVYAKDVILYLISTLGSDGANYRALEWGGTGIRMLPMNERLVLSNMAVEAGAKVGLIPTDEVTRVYLEEMGRGERFRFIEADHDAEYESILKIDASTLKPYISLPHSVDNVKPIDEVEKVKIDLVFIGSCTNARLEDLHIVSRILGGREIKSRLIVTSASRRVYIDAVKDGTVELLLKAGALITPPGCGICFGALGGVPADAETVFSTSNRNFKGRMGNPNAYTYLGSPATAAATAVEGRIADPRDYI